VKTLKVVFVGHTCIDRNDAEHVTYVSWGSGALHMARYFQDHFGINPDVITTYGPDLLEYTKGFRLHPLKPQAKVTMLNENIMSGREKDRIRYSHHAEESIEPEITNDVIDLVSKADILVLATLLPNYSPAYVKKLLSHSKPGCLKVLIAQGYLRHVNSDGLISARDFPEAKNIIPQFDLTVYSDDDHPDALNLAKHWKSIAPNTDIIVTQGPQGASIFHGDHSAHNIPTRPMPIEEIVDSVGCGEIFTAAVTYHYYQSRDLVSAVQAAHRAARSKLVLSNAAV
jgi:sugar/nucleoside kinase (ribokinase family)